MIWIGLLSCGTPAPAPAPAHETCETFLAKHSCTPCPTDGDLVVTADLFSDGRIVTDVHEGDAVALRGLITNHGPATSVPACAVDGWHYVGGGHGTADCLGGDLTLPAGATTSALFRGFVAEGTGEQVGVVYSHVPTECCACTEWTVQPSSASN